MASLLLYVPCGFWPVNSLTSCKIYRSTKCRQLQLTLADMFYENAQHWDLWNEYADKSSRITKLVPSVILVDPAWHRRYNVSKTLISGCLGGENCLRDNAHLIVTGTLSTSSEQYARPWSFWFCWCLLCSRRLDAHHWRHAWFGNDLKWISHLNHVVTKPSKVWWISVCTQRFTKPRWIGIQLWLVNCLVLHKLKKSHVNHLVNAVTFIVLVTCQYVTSNKS